MKREIKSAITKRDIDYLLNVNYNLLDRKEINKIYKRLKKYLKQEIEINNLVDIITNNLELFKKKRSLPNKGCFKIEIQDD